jgi:hypothetical protein
MAGKAGWRSSTAERFSADIREAFAVAADRQRESLSGAGERLSGLTQGSKLAVGPEAARIVRGEITKCVADAATETAAIWAGLTARVQQGCARFDLMAGPEVQDGPNGDSVEDPCEAGIGGARS